MVIDHQYPNTCHCHPHIPGGGQCGYGARSGAATRRTAAAALMTYTPPRASYLPVSPPDQRRPPPTLCISVRRGSRNGSRLAKLLDPPVYGELSVQY
ncbi:hypothetical protein GCM10010324_23580 [Streptomyces hiroshimensis]|uniref:Uncharacterized protein n=1 Tax=Streptomyces hiroshimensis TaxID=66424 RepID=A0ABQ2YAV4_9ACTN|nr:hypothetical protein GCM10010324_23580 [Streptomyces hiroshimensis]